MRSSAAVLILLLAGCAANPSGGDVAGARTSWNGATYDEVVAKWGTPVRSTKMSDGRDVYTWVSESVGTSHSPSFFPSLGIFGGSGGVGLGTGVTFGGGGAASELYRCERTLIFREGRVQEQTWQGAADYCSGFRR
jgi:hypothetical protein